MKFLGQRQVYNISVEARTLATFPLINNKAETPKDSSLTARLLADKIFLDTKAQRERTNPSKNNLVSKRAPAFCSFVAPRLSSPSVS